MTQTPEADASTSGTGESRAGAAAPVAASERTGSGVTSARSDRLLDELLDRLCQVMSADVAQFLLIEGTQLRVLASHGVPLERVADLRIPVGRGFTGTVAATAAPAVLPDTSALETFGASWAEEGVRSLVGVPVIVDDRVIGVAQVGARTDRAFGDHDIALLSAAAERAAWAVEHGFLLAAERQARASAASVSERLDRLRDMAHALLSDLTVDGVVRTVVAQGLSLVGAFGGAVWETAPDGSALLLRSMVGYPEDVQQRWERIEIAGEGPVAEAARTGTPIVIRSVAERDARYPDLRGRATAGEAFVAAPLIVDGTAIGLLGLGFDHADDLDDEGLRFIDAATAQCAAAMHRAFVVEAQQHSLAEAQRSAQRLATLQRLTAALADVRAGGAVDAILGEVMAAVGARQAALCVLDEAAGEMNIVSARGISGRLQDEFRAFPLRAGLPATDALLRREPILLRNIDERQALYPALQDHTMASAWATLPLLIGERALGSLALSLDQPQEFTATDVEFLTALADQCAHALERARLLEVQARSARRLELLAEAGRIFSAPLDVQLTSLQFARLMVGRIADAVSVHLREPDGSYSLAAAEHVDPEQTGVQRTISQRLPKAVTDTYDAILDSRDALLLPDVPMDAFLDTVEDPELRAALAERPARSNILLPLVAGGHSLGILSVTTVEGGREPLGQHDLEQLEELAGRLALAIDSARLLRQQTEIAHTLQRSLLPAALPRVPGAEVSVRYLAGDEGVDVGGDFYDVIPLPSGRIGLIVGDVMGRGVRAAAVMGQLRAAVRSYCLEGHPPAALLTRLDRLVGTLEEGMLVTAFYAEWDPGRSTVLCSCAGHLPPLVRLPDEEPTYLEIDPGVPLGVGVQSYVEVELTLPPGSLLLAYTDGLVEGPDLPHDEGMRRLALAVAGAARAGDVCDRALAELRPFGGERRYDDDTAMLALVAVAEDAAEDDGPDGVAVSDGRVSLDLPADNSSPARARALVDQTLHAWSLPVLADAGTLLVSELVTNAVRHAGTGLRLTVQRRGERRVRISVSDRAPDVEVRLRPATEDSEGGRGLFLVEHLASTWGAEADGEGKTVWFELQA